MSWKIKFSERAINDLKAIYEYIAFELLVPETAAKQVDRLIKSVNILVEMPMMYRVYDDEPWQSKGMRCFSVDNYIVLYLPKKEENTVSIIRIIYGGRDIKRQLEEGKDMN